MPKYPIPSAAIDRVQNEFTHHAPHSDQGTRYEYLRLLAKEMAMAYFGECPPSREQSLALTKLDESLRWGLASIARHEKPAEEGA